jgi:2,3-bisphosphoglycerate-independent phosphoglycerate mutase
MEEEVKFVILIVLDGWGIAPPGPGNAISLANTINMNKLWRSYPHTQLLAFGEAVGLPSQEAGNTETGHLNLGAGKIVYQDLERINMSIADGSFFTNKTLLSAIEHAKSNNSNLHIMGLLGGGNVHSSSQHLHALIHMASVNKMDRLFLHLFTDGRDSPPTAANSYIQQLNAVLKKEKVGKIASVMGRYWGMDRDHRWDRTQKAYEALTMGIGKITTDIVKEIDNNYSQGITDEFIEPTLIADENGKPTVVKDNDAVIFFNYRIDRPRQLTHAFVATNFKSEPKEDFDPYKIKYEKTHLEKETAPVNEDLFQRKNVLKNLVFVTMTKYSNTLVEEGAAPAFPPDIINMPLGRVVSLAGKRQLRLTESEKERFVTFYFNGLRESPFEGEEKTIVPSQKVPTYDQKPEMSAEEITQTLINRLSAGDLSFILVNFPNADMLGHTGNIGPAVKGIEKVDECIGRIANYVLAYNGAMLITADHGNAEEMINQKTGEIGTEHSTYPVPFICITKKFLGKNITLPTGILADVAPTVLSMLGITVPETMTGRNLLRDINVR